MKHFVYSIRLLYRIGNKTGTKITIVLLLLFLGLCSPILSRGLVTSNNPKFPAASATTVPDFSLEALPWLKENAIPFENSDLVDGIDDLIPIKEVVGDAQVVALGEATHGTHEFFELKNRVFKFLVLEMGFNTFMIEANWAEANLINQYIHTGIGDPAELLENLGYWTWNSQEILDLILWMRSYNKNPKHSAKLSFYGFDMQPSQKPIADLKAYLAKIDPNKVSWVDHDLDNLYDHMTRQQANYIAISSPSEFAYALQSARISMQSQEIQRSPAKALELRDLYMAQNVVWILNQAGTDAKAVVWAHNAHVNVSQSGFKKMGMYLRKEFGNDMVVFGFSFYHGLTNAITQYLSGETGTLGVHYIPPPPPKTYEAIFHAVSLPRFIVDLRKAERESANSWFSLEPYYFRKVGAAVNDCYPEHNFYESSINEEFDVIVYFEETTPSQLLGISESSRSKVTTQVCANQPQNLGFETGVVGWFMDGTRIQDYEYGSDTHTKHEGRASGYIKFKSEKVSGSGVIMQTFRADQFNGDRLQLNVYVLTDNIDGQVYLFLRTDGMGWKQLTSKQVIIRNKNGWKEYETILDLPENSISISFGVYMEGRGQIWIDDIHLNVVDKENKSLRQN